MNAEQNLNLVRRLFEDYYNKENPAICEEAFASNIRLNDAAISSHLDGVKALKEAETIYRKAFPDKLTKIEDIFAAEDKVVVRWSVIGTHRGDLQGIEPTNKKIQLKGITICYFKNGKISEIHQSWDRLGLFEQIGELQKLHALH